MIEAVIFDMDGLMVDSELTRAQSFKSVISKHGVEIKDAIPHVIGLRVLDNWRIMSEKYGLKETPEQLMEEGEKEYTKIIEESAPVAMPGLFELVELIEAKQLKRAIVSSSGIVHIKIKLKKLGLDSFFGTVISGDMLTKGKPDPEGYLLAATKLKVDPSRCLVLEDAPSGVQAAKVAGMQCIAVPNVYTKDDDFSKANLVVNSLQDIKWGTIETL